MHRFSIIVPVYNVQDYLGQCVDSVLSQDFSDFELILVDDGSTDNSPALCDAYAKADTRVKVIHKKNGGASDARNQGLDRAQGEYIVFLDSDDFWNRKDALDLIHRVVEKNTPDIVMFGCTDWNMQNHKTIISRTDYDQSFFVKKEMWKTLHYLLSQKKLPGGPYLFFVKRQIIEDHKIRFQVGIQDEDYDYVLSVFLQAQDVFAVNDPFYTYRKGRSDAVTSSYSIKMIYGIEYTINKWLPICEKIDDPIVKKDLLNYIAFIYSTGFVVLGRIKKDEKKEAISIMQKYTDVLQYAYWRKQRITKIAVKVLGIRLFSFLASVYFRMTHI